MLCVKNKGKTFDRGYIDQILDELEKDEYNIYEISINEYRENSVLKTVHISAKRENTEENINCFE